MDNKLKNNREKELWGTLIFILFVCVISTSLMVAENYIPEEKGFLILVVFVIPAMILSASLARILSVKIIKSKYGKGD
jgi:uncharacterized protein (DUF983 family)